MKESEINMTEYNLIQVFITMSQTKCVDQSYSRLVAARVTTGHFTDVVRIKIGFIR